MIGFLVAVACFLYALTTADANANLLDLAKPIADSLHSWFYFWVFAGPISAVLWIFLAVALAVKSDKKEAEALGKSMGKALTGGFASWFFNFAYCCATYVMLGATSVERFLIPLVILVVLLAGRFSYRIAVSFRKDD